MKRFILFSIISTIFFFQANAAEMRLINLPRHENIITAYFDRIIHSGDLTLLYDNTPIASISVYGSYHDYASWLVNKRTIRCEDINNEKRLLSVEHNMKKIPVKQFTCKPILDTNG